MPGKSPAVLQGREQHGIERRGLLHACGIVHVRMSPHIDKDRLRS
ncbi:hypothetical protein QTH90_03395 [Variovorax sp. J2P1-59]|nr:hypothetical protein [Variovorax sp. J2P1-59]MDM0073409.1 hypothetical protein [Variovorax sp. J2P1-59]